MDITSIILIVLGLAVVALVVTPTGRKAIGNFFRAFGAGAQTATDKLHTAELRRQELKTLAEQEATQQTTGLETSQQLAETVIAEYERVQREVGQYEANKQKALANLDRLTSDTVPDEKQVEEIGLNKALLLQAEQAIQAKTAYLERMRPKVEQMQAAQRRASALKQAVVAEKTRKEQAADILAAEITGSQVETKIHHSISTHSNSEAGKALSELQRMADEARGAAMAAKDTMMQMPASPEIAAALLDSAGTDRDADVERLLNEYRAQKSAPVN